MKEVMKWSQQAEECDKQVTPADSRSTTSKSTAMHISKPASQSVLSSSSSIRMKAEMEHAALKAKAATLQEKLAIEKEEAEFEEQQKRIEAAIKARKEMHAMQTALAELDAKMEVLQKYENTQTDRTSIGSDKQPTKKEVKIVIQPPPQLIAPIPDVKPNVQTAPPQKASATPKTPSKTQPVDASSKPCVYCKGEQHSLTVCRKLKSKSHKEKIDFLRCKGLCFACLKHGHMSSSCREKVQCNDYSRLHPTLLHINIKDS